MDYEKSFFMTFSEDTFLKALRKIPINPREGKLILFADKIREKNKLSNYEEKCIENKIIPYSRSIQKGEHNLNISLKDNLLDFKYLVTLTNNPS